MNLDHHIAALLKDHDCVVVPNFGGFVANYAPAKINPVNHRFDPPNRKVSFNKLLTHNDGLLASYVARQEAKRYEAGLKMVQDYALFLRSELKTERRVKLEKVGVLSLNMDGSIRFEQLENGEFYSDGTGLESFFAHRIVKEEAAPVVIARPKPSIEEKKAPKKAEPKVIPFPMAAEPQKETPIDEPQKSEQEEHSKDSRKSFPILKLAAAAVLLPLIGYTVWLSAFTPVLHKRSLDYSDLNPLSSSASETYTPRKGRITIASDSYSVRWSESEDADFLSFSKSTEPDKTLVVNKTEQLKPEVAENLRYHIIGGCFGMPENAEGLAEKYRQLGNKAGIIDKRGSLLRVSVASFATKKEAQQKLASIKADLPGAWLLYK